MGSHLGSLPAPTSSVPPGQADFHPRMWLRTSTTGCLRARQGRVSLGTSCVKTDLTTVCFTPSTGGEKGYPWLAPPAGRAISHHALLPRRHHTQGGRTKHPPGKHSTRKARKELVLSIKNERRKRNMEGSSRAEGQDKVVITGVNRGVMGGAGPGEPQGCLGTPQCTNSLMSSPGQHH